jgi:hypothetical protein
MMLRLIVSLLALPFAQAHFSQCGNGAEGEQGVKVTNLSPALNLTAPFLVSHHKASIHTSRYTTHSAACTSNH